MTHLIKPDVLLVEDNRRDADLAMRALKKKKLVNNLLWLKDGQECLDFLLGRGQYEGRDVSQLPKVVLLDLKMPKMNGLEVLEQLRNNPNTRSLPVVMLTSSREDRDIIKSYDLGVNSYIVKPVDFDKFMDAVNNLGMYWLMVNQSPIVKI